MSNCEKEVVKIGKQLDKMISSDVSLFPFLLNRIAIVEFNSFSVKISLQFIFIKF